MTLVDDVRSSVLSGVDSFVAGVQEAIPQIIAGAIFLTLAGLLVWAVLRVVRAFLRRVFDEEDVYVQFVSTLVAVFLWFGVLLSFLSIVGLTAIAAALGTATGFVALGVSYALSDMIEDAVSGVYLLRDPDFNPGDVVTAGQTTGVVEEIELRKTRIQVDGNVVVRANAEIEKQWTRHVEESDVNWTET